MKCSAQGLAQSAQQLLDSSVDLKQAFVFSAFL